MTGSAVASSLPTYAANRPPSRARRLLRVARSKPLGAFGALVTIGFAFVAIFAPLLVTHDPLATSADFLQGPSLGHWFGTDNLGRDIYSRLVTGSRVSIRVGVVAVVLSTVAGSFLGMAAGYFRGWIDPAIMRVMDVMMAFPSLILALAIMAALGPSINNVTAAIAITQVPAVSRVVRSQVLSIKEQQFIQAAHTLGARDGRILMTYVLPNVMPTIIIYASTNLGYAILTEGTLSFLGVGIPPPNPSWGEALSGQARLFFTTAPWLAFFPIGALTLAILGAVLLGDALRDVLDPRMRGTR